MAIAAHFDTEFEGNPAVQPRAARRALRLEAEGALPSGEATRVSVHNVSQTGLLLECAEELVAGETILVDLPEAGLTPARVVWSSGALHGCAFATPITPATLSAAELRSAVSGTLALDPDAPPSGGEGLGARLQRLRKARGLTMTQVADALGVSKPTVWAWEHERARPVHGRIAALCDLLGVERSALLAEADPDTVARVVARARSEIAAALGMDPPRVRIMLDL